MKPYISLWSTFNKRNYFLVLLILFIITTNAEGARLASETHSRSGVGINPATSSPQQIIKSKFSHPLSNLNFNKTRPRGIPAQEPVVKYSLHCGPILLYPPFRLGFIEPDSFLPYSLFGGNTCSIRPPPSHCVL
jgi:hypothetical protein